MKKNKEKQPNKATDLMMKQSMLRRHAVLSGVSLTLVTVLILGAVLAWYTRLTNVTGMTFDAAEFDINASYVSDSFIINPNDYNEIENGLSAPGAMGYIPVKVYTSGNNQVAANYRLNVDNASMAPEFAERIRFYYYTREDGVYVEHDLGLGTEDIVGTLKVGTDDATEYIYWEWMYEADIKPVLIAPTEYPSNEAEEYTEFTSMDEMTNEDIYYAVYNWRQNNGSAADYEELNRYAVLDIKNDSDIYKLYYGDEFTKNSVETDYNGQVIPETTYQAVPKTDPDYINKRGANLRDYIETYGMGAWDLVDTNIALGVWDKNMTSRSGLTYQQETITDENNISKTYLAYQMAMQVTLSMTGVQAEPLEEDETKPAIGTGTVLREN